MFNREIGKFASTSIRVFSATTIAGVLLFASPSPVNEPDNQVGRGYYLDSGFGYNGLVIRLGLEDNSNFGWEVEFIAGAREISRTDRLRLPYHKPWIGSFTKFLDSAGCGLKDSADYNYRADHIECW